MVKLFYVKNIFVCVFQESPTGELADFAFSTETESSAQKSSEEDDTPQPDPVREAQSCETFCASEERDGSISEDGEFLKSIKHNIS